MRLLHLLPLLSLACADVNLIDLATASPRTVEAAALRARHLLHTETIATLSTVFPAGEPHGLEHQPIGLMDYYADCSPNGHPTLLGFRIGTSFRNAFAPNATISLSVREHLPGRFSPAAHPRLALQGRLVEVEEEDGVKECFTGRHRDARLWTPGNRIHETYWTRFEVEKIYWIGGFGNVAYIGWIPKEMYEAVKVEDVRKLMGEETGFFEQGL